MFPVRDDNPTLRTPIVTILLIAVNTAVWIGIQGVGLDPALGRSVCEFGVIPAELSGLGSTEMVQISATTACVVGSKPEWPTVLTSMFMHGGWMHLIGNMWFLWIFGNNVEDSMGRFRFLCFYLLCGAAAVGAQIATDPSSPIPMVGASGAIGGVMGAYILLYPTVRVHMLVVLGIFITTIYVPAYLMLGYWLLLQVLGGVPALGAHTAGVAFWAHIGGFAAGFLLITPFKDRRLVDEHRRSLVRYGT